MPYAKDLNGFGRHAVSDDVGPQRDQLSGSCHAPRPSPFRQVFQAVTRRDKLNGNPVRSAGIIMSDIVPDVLKVGQGQRRQDYGHGGAGRSVSVPQDSSQARTAS